MIALYAIAGVIIGIRLWEVMSSALLCLFTRQWVLFVFPYNQWIQATRWFKAVGWVMRLAIVGSATVPTLVLMLIGVAIANALWRVEKRPSLYGATGWAPKEEREQHGITHSISL
jgi:hypothetical protein